MTLTTSAIGWRSGARIAARVGVAVFGNYALTSGLASLLAVTLSLAGMPRVEAVALAAMVAYPVYLIVLLWAFHRAELPMVWGIVSGVGAASHVLARLLAASLPAAGAMVP